MSRTLVETSGEVNVIMAVHVLKVPSIETDASTSNRILLSVGVISKTGTLAGACARVTHEDHRNTRSQKISRGWQRINMSLLFDIPATFDTSASTPDVRIRLSTPFA